MSFDYDLFVIGAGPAGLAAAERAGNYGKKVAVAERDKVGGDCVNYGCIPEKLMFFAANFSKLYKDAVKYGWSEAHSTFDWSRFMVTRNEFIQRLNRTHIQHLQEAKVEFIQGFVTFVDAHTLRIGEHLVTADKILIAVGASDVKPDVEGVEHALTWSQVFQLQQQPKHVAIIGSSYIDVKTAGNLHGMGSKVTLIFPEEQLLPGYDADIAKFIQTSMSKRGIEIYSKTKTEKIQLQEEFHLKLSGCQTLTADTVLYAIQRAPDLINLGLEKAGVKVNSAGAIIVNDSFHTSQDNIFAVGDCTERTMYRVTPVAIAESRAFVDTVFGASEQTVNYEFVPIILSSDPEAASVGLSEEQASLKFGNTVRSYYKEFKPLLYCLSGRDEKSLMKLVVNSESGRVLGVHIVGESAIEMIQGMTLALNLGATKKDFDRTIGIHPSCAEEIFSLQ